MKEFTTITEHRVLWYAWNEIAERINHEEEINKRTIEEYGHENSISLHHIARYNAQSKEISDRILEIEKSEI